MDVNEVSTIKNRSDEKSRDARINLRLATSQAALLKKAADAQETTLTEFVLSSASAAAEHVLADRRWFRLDPDEWAAFEAALERPAIFKPRLSDVVKDDSFFVD